jgi:hypothetical protein
MCCLTWLPAGAGDGWAASRTIDRDVYADRLRAMWLAESIANWTGLRTEGLFQEPPFPTDDDWGRNLGKGPVVFVIEDPFRADDDTDIEYVYVHLLDELGGGNGGVTALTGEQIRDGWIKHINRFIWVSNERARELMGRGVVPEETGFNGANHWWLMIDAQLTTEVFGAFCPGMPERALEMADLPIATTARGHAAHAAQVHVVMHSLAPMVPDDLEPAERAVWLVERSREFLPDTSKCADIMDFVLADYLGNPDKDDWERTRDRIHDRYQLHAADNGFVYRHWFESSINFASGVMALLYGEGDFKRTVQIATLGGWDSDNPAATMGGLIGLMSGTDAIAAAFPGQALSDRYNSWRTRDNLPDHLPDDPDAEDTFTMIAERMLPVVEAVILEEGGRVDDDAGTWLLPPVVDGSLVDRNPRHAVSLASANNAVRARGGNVNAWSSVTSDPPSPWITYGSNQPKHFANGVEHDYSGVDPADTTRHFYTTQHDSPVREVILETRYSMAISAGIIRFVEGDHFDDDLANGGWFESVDVEVRLPGGVWVAADLGAVPTLDAARPFQVLDFILDAPVDITGVRVRGVPGGTHGFVTCAELDALGTIERNPRLGFDIDGDGRASIDDLYTLHQHPADLNADDVADGVDLRYLERALRWREAKDMSMGRMEWGE